MKKGLSQEGLKTIACLTMLLDHIGAVLVPGFGLRMIGRISFPIYCFLLAEGFHHTRNRKRYGLRLLIGALISEIPFDLAFYGRINWGHQSVMLTLLIGFCMLWWMEKRDKILPVAAAIFAAELLGTDYGGFGVVLVALFSLTREETWRIPLQFAGLAACFYLMNSVPVQVLGLSVPIQFFGLAAMVPILCYSGSKATGNRVLQWIFYLSYPAHLIVLYGIAQIIG